MEFVSPTSGTLSFPQMFRELASFVEEDIDRTYNVIVGTDSMLTDKTTFVTAVIIHRVGRGGRYFYKKRVDRKMPSIKERMLHEALLSMEMAHQLKTVLSQNGYAKLPVTIHLDVGENGVTREVIREVVGMVTGSGYEAVVKPDAYGATKVADRHSK
jgi:predicted RNase H-related nuclease YkuK (DUF458 family)